MIDWSRIKSLRDEVGAEDFDEIVDVFIEEVTDMTDRLRTAPQPGALGENLHALKGSALNLGFTTFAELCQSGESLAAQGHADQINLAQVLECYEASRTAFLSGLAEGAAV